MGVPKIRKIVVHGSAVLAALVMSAAVSFAADDERHTALRYLGLGADAYRMGDLAEATRHWGEAIRFCRIAADPSLEAEARARRGEALESLGQFRAAIDDLTLGYAEAQKARNPAQIASLAGALGNIYFQTKQLEQARSFLDKSLELAHRDGLLRVVAASENNLGNLLFATGEHAEAANAYARAEEAAQRIGDAGLVVTARTNEARVEVRLGHHKSAAALMQKALDGALALPASRDKTYALLAIGHLAQPDRDRATTSGNEVLATRQAIGYRALRTATQLAEESGDQRAASLGWGYLGELYETAKRRDEARSLGERAIALARRIDASDLLYRWEWLQGRLASADGNRDAAIAAYRQAIDALEAVRQDVPVEYVDGRSSFRETVGPLYFGLADLLLQKAPTLAGAAASSILLEARQTVETLKTAEIRDYFKEPCLTALQAKETSIERAIGASGRTAVLYPIILRDRVELLLSFADGVQQYTSGVDEAELTKTAHALRAAVETLGRRDYFEPAERLYGWLVRPLENALAAHGIDTLVVIPDGVLRTIPFGALYDGKNFLISKYALATAPGLTLIDPQPIARRQVHALFAGLSKPVQGYPALPFVNDELATLSGLQRGEVLTNETFSEAAIETSLKTVPYTVVHLASHGEFNGDPDKTYILTYDGKLTLDKLEETVKFGEFRDQPLELLSLSACRTAAGDDRAALGLAGVAVKSGARSAVASLWFINDEASSKLIELFYEDLSRGNISKAKAMQQAQLTLMKDRRFRHPGFWSPFLVIGNWL